MAEAADPRITPVRDDLAADGLRARFPGRRYSQGAANQVIIDGTPLRFSPDAGATTESQLVYGETFTVYENREGWAWGQNGSDGYVGYVPGSSLRAGVREPDHKVVTRSTFLYPAADIKAPPSAKVSMGAQLKIVDVDGDFVQTDAGAWVFAKHLVETSYIMPDLVATAFKFLGTPYLWGGRSCRGLDCSALVQFALGMAGIAAPRDSDQQAAAIGVEVPMANSNDLSGIEDGDLIFFPGHVGFYVEHWRFLHANAYDMQVSVNNLSDVLDRANKEGAGITCIRRAGVRPDRRKKTRPEDTQETQ
jgi:cell wall-associated NlpC family hydrolase